MSNIVKQCNGRKSKKTKELEKNVISKLPKEFHQFTKKQLHQYREYIESMMIEGEIRFVSAYENPQSETYGNQIRSYALAYGHLSELEHGSKHPKYMKVRDNAQEVWKRDRVQRYVQLMRYIKGHDLAQAVPLANSRLIGLIEQVDDKGLTLQAIKELHKILGTVSDGVNIQINNGESQPQFNWDNLTKDEIEQYLYLTEKLRDTSANNNNDNADNGEIIDSNQ